MAVLVAAAQPIGAMRTHECPVKSARFTLRAERLQRRTETADSGPDRDGMLTGMLTAGRCCALWIRVLRACANLRWRVRE